MSTLNDFLHDDAIDLAVSASDWRSAITSAGNLLQHTGAIDPEYTAAMIQSVEDNGPYIVVAPGFAFAHARPSAAVHRTSVAWTRLTEPVEFGNKKNDPVTLVVALAAKDAHAHTDAMRDIARVLADPQRRQQLDTATSVEELREILDGATQPVKAGQRSAEASKSEAAASETTTSHQTAADSVESKGKILTVCGNGLGTSLFLKNTLDQILTRWGWDSYLTVEATDTISAKGRAKEADFLMTSGEIARTLGDVGVPVWVIDNFTSEEEIDSALRKLYDV